MSQPVTAKPEDDVVVTRPFEGLGHMQVCAYCETPPEVVEAKANLLNPTGASLGWKVILEDDEHEPHLRPRRCGDYPDRLHYMLAW